MSGCRIICVIYPEAPSGENLLFVNGFSYVGIYRSKFYVLTNIKRKKLEEYPNVVPHNIQTFLSLYMCIKGRFKKNIKSSNFFFRI